MLKWHGEYWERDETAKEIVREAWKTAKKGMPKGAGLISGRLDISRYAKETFSETVAEALSDYFSNREAAKPLSRAIVEVLRKKAEK